MWGVTELARGVAREVMNKKKDRGAGKTTNFCLAKDTPVLTDSGYKPIKDVQLNDLLWDGVEWVRHKGLHCYGTHKTIEYEGIRATPEHIVWTEGGRTTLLDAAVRKLTLVKTAEQGKIIQVPIHDDISRRNSCKSMRQATASLREGTMHPMWDGVLETYGKFGSQQGDTMSLLCAQITQGSLEGSDSTIGEEVQLHDATLLQRFTQTVKRLQRQGYTSAIFFTKRICSMGTKSVSWRDICREGVRPHRQRRSLLKRQFTADKQCCKSSSHEANVQKEIASRPVPSEVPGLHVQSCDCVQPSETRADIRTDIRTIAACLSYWKKEAEILKSSMETDVYDLVDAGKRHRFTANDRLVSNSSSYGGTARSIARKIEQDTGNKLTEEEAQALLDAVESRQPRATAFFHEMERIPYEVGYMRAKSGRVRHCLTLAKDTQGLSSRQWESQVTALGRECRNFYLQESVGASASRACVKAVQFYMTMKEKYGLQGYLCVCLYDSLVIHCPEEERHIWQLAIDLFMHLSTGWRYNDRILNYTIDLELNAGWSFKPDKEWAIKLHDPNYKPTPDRLKELESLLEAQCAFYKGNPEFSIYPPEDMEYKK